MRLTILTPVLNAAHLLPTCIASTRLPDCEHLFIDGGSTDGSRELIQRHTSNTTRLIDAPGSGIYEAQNIGINAAAEEWIYVMGADDRLRPDAVSKLLSAINGINISYARVLMSYGHIRPHYSSMQQSWVYRRSLLIERGGFTAPGLAEIQFNQNIADLPHIRTGVVFCDVAMGGVSSRGYRNDVCI